MKVNKSNDTKHFYCAICEARLDRVARWNKVEKNELILKLNLLKEGIKVGDRICNRCNSRARILANNDDTFEKTKNKDNIIQNDINDEDNMPIENFDNFETIDESQKESKILSSQVSSSSSNSGLQVSICSLTKDPVYVDLARTSCNEKKCIFCCKKRGKKNNKLHRISNKSISDAYIKTSILIPFNSRACRSHFDEYGYLKTSCLGKIKD
jgi:hypothetical protein